MSVRQTVAVLLTKYRTERAQLATELSRQTDQRHHAAIRDGIDTFDFVIERLERVHDVAEASMALKELHSELEGFHSAGRFGVLRTAIEFLESEVITPIQPVPSGPPEEIRRAAIRFLRKNIDPAVRTRIREDIGRLGPGWASELHFPLGMAVRNQLRRAGFNESALDVSSLDEAWAALLEEAVAASDVHVDPGISADPEVTDAPARVHTLARTIERTLEGGMAKHFRSQEYLKRRALAESIFHHIVSPVEPLFDVVLGVKPTIRPGYPRMTTLNFPRKVLGIPNVSALPPKQSAEVRRLITDVFGLGVLMQYLFFNFPSRERVLSVDLGSTFDEWAMNSLVANTKMKEWDTDAEGLPSLFFAMYFRDRIESDLKQGHGVGFWRMGKASSLLENVFFAGAHWAIACDLTTVELRTRVSPEE